LYVSWLKWALAQEQPPGLRAELLDQLHTAASTPGLTEATIAAIQPMQAGELELWDAARSLDPPNEHHGRHSYPALLKKYHLFAQLNPSLPQPRS
jgi:uncharacterized protein (DUF342 family)